MVAPRPVKDFSKSSNPLGDMHQSYVAARARMEAAGRREAAEPLVRISAPDRALTRAAYLEAMSEMRRGDHSVRSILRVVAAVTGVSTESIRSDTRAADVALARMIVCFLSREETDQSFAQIGLVVCRDASTAAHGHERVSSIIDELGICYTPNVVEMAARVWASRFVRAA